MIDDSATTTLIYFQQLLTEFGLPVDAGELSASITVDDRLTLQITTLDDGQMTLTTPLAGEEKELTPAFARRFWRQISYAAAPGKRCWAWPKASLSCCAPSSQDSSPTRSSARWWRIL
nr:hypothetical protein [Verrucomicrobium spinosum]